MVLKRMKRRHLRHDIVAFAQKVRSLRPDMVFGADIIAGFPTETDAMFENTLRLVDELQLIHLHVFPYSAREGTPAAKMPQVAKTLRKERAARLREAGEKQLAAWLKDQVGKTASVVVEKPRLARSEHFAMVELDCDLVPGSVAQVSLVAQNSQLLQGRV